MNKSPGEVKRGGGRGEVKKTARERVFSKIGHYISEGQTLVSQEDGELVGKSSAWYVAMPGVAAPMNLARWSSFGSGKRGRKSTQRGQTSPGMR